MSDAGHTRAGAYARVMPHAFAAAPIAAFAFVTLLALAAIAIRHGLIADDALRLWAGASTAARWRCLSGARGR